jgi:hypothetical protein
MVDGKCVKKDVAEQIGDPKTQSTQGTLPDGDSGDKQTADQHPCDETETWNETTQMCEPKVKKDQGIGQTMNTDNTASVEAKLNQLTGLVSKMAETQITAASIQTTKKPTASAATSETVDSEHLSMDEIASRLVPSLEKYGQYKFNIPLEYLRSINVGLAKAGDHVMEAYRPAPLSIRDAYSNPNRLISESLGTLKEAGATISGTHATAAVDTDVAIVPGGISFVPVFQFAKVKKPEQGSNIARFLVTDLPVPLSQTAGTTATESTQTFTSVDITPSQITGNYLTVNFDLIENSPFDLLQAVVEGSAASYDDFVATDMLNTVSAEGTLTPGLWINAETGATITTSDTSGIDFDETGIAFGREYLEDQGYLRGGIKPVLAMHPNQWRQLITSTNVTSLATHSTPDIWLKAELEEFMGVQLVVTNAIEINAAQTNTAYNALMFIPKHSYGIGVMRDVTVKFHDIGEDNQVRVNTTWRAKAGVLDSASIVRISSTVA